MKLVIAEPLHIPQKRLEELLRRTVGDRMEVISYGAPPQSVEELAGRCREADAVIFLDLPFSRQVLRQCPRLKQLCTLISGVDHIDLPACREQGIAVCNTPGYASNAVVEMTFALLLAVTRKVVACDRASRTQQGQRGLMGVELEGKTFGVAGAGSIGLRVARIAQAFGCRVLCYNRTPKPETGFPFVDLDTLLRQSDILSLHLPLTPQTQQLINRQRLAVMKPSAILINTARGGLVDSAALAQQLREGRLAGAGLDVLDLEPPFPPGHPLLQAPNVVLAPHIGFATRDALERRIRQLEENLSGWLGEGVPRYPV